MALTARRIYSIGRSGDPGAGAHRYPGALGLKWDRCIPRAGSVDRAGLLLDAS